MSAESPETWSYDKDVRFDKQGNRWHFVRRDNIDMRPPYDEQPFEVYFRNDARTEYGVLKFARRKDFPYRNYIVMVTKIMNDAEFRRALLAPETERVWRRSWK